MQTLKLLFLALVLFSAELSYAQPGGIVGLTTLHPEKLAGLWETRAGGITYGLTIQITTQIKGLPKTLASMPQTVAEAQAGVFARSGPVLKLGEANWFLAGHAGATWTATRIALHAAVGPGTSAVMVDLSYDRNSDTWSGRFRRGDFDGHLVLRRPQASASDRTGTWKRAGPLSQCLHVEESEDGALAGWADFLVTPGLLRYANGIHPPETTREIYGSLASVEQTGSNFLTITLDPFTALCCSLQEGAILMPGKRYLRTVPISGSGLPALWERVRGDSCVAPAFAAH